MTKPDQQLLADLRAVRELLAVPERWTQGSYARRKTGEAIGSRLNGAVCWCLEGAIFRVCGSEWVERINPLSRLIESMCKISIPNWNDAPERTHADVLALLDRAIAAEEAQLTNPETTKETL